MVANTPRVSNSAVANMTAIDIPSIFPSKQGGIAAAMAVAVLSSALLIIYAPCMALIKGYTVSIRAVCAALVYIGHTVIWVIVTSLRCMVWIANSAVGRTAKKIDLWTWPYQVWVYRKIIWPIGMVLCTVFYIPYILLSKGRNSRIYKMGERFSCTVMFLLSLITTGALVSFFVSVYDSVRTFFAGGVSVSDFLFGRFWSIAGSLTASGEIDPDKVGALALFWGTFYIAIISMLTAWTIGYPAAIFARKLARKYQVIAKSICRVCIGIPSIVWGLLAAFVVGPFLVSLSRLSEIFPPVEEFSAFTAGITVGAMLSPWVVLYVLEALQERGLDGQWEAAQALGMREDVAFAKVVRPQCKPLILAALITTGSKALTETMVVLLAAGFAPNISLNPFEGMTTVTVQIADLMKGDLAFDHPAVKASFALLLTLMLVVLFANIQIRKYDKRLHETQNEKKKKVGRQSNSPRARPGVMLSVLLSRFTTTVKLPHVLLLLVFAALALGVYAYWCGRTTAISLERYQEGVRKKKAERLSRKSQVYEPLSMRLGLTHGLTHNRWLRGLAAAWVFVSFTGRNAFCFVIAMSIPFMVGVAVVAKATPALMLTYVTFPCQGMAEGATVTSRDLLRERLHIESSLTGISERDAKRDANRLLITDLNDEIACGIRTPVGDKVDEWFKGQAWWLNVQPKNPPPLGEALANAGTLELEFRLVQVFFGGDSNSSGIAGMGRAIAGTTWALVGILLVSIPGVLVAVYLHFWLHSRGLLGKQVANSIEIAGNTLLGLPVIAIGIVGYEVFIRWIGLPSGSGLVIMLTLSLAAFPFVILSTLAAITSIPHKISQLEAGKSVGLTHFEAVWKTVVPQAAPKIISGIINATVYAIGETALLLPIGGNSFTNKVHWDPMESTTTLPGQVYRWIKADEAGFQELAALAATVLLLLCLCLSLLGDYAARRQGAERKGLTEKRLKGARPWRLPYRMLMDYGPNVVRVVRSRVS